MSFFDQPDSEGNAGARMLAVLLGLMIFAALFLGSLAWFLG